MLAIKPSVLLAEDDPITREVIEVHLRELRCSFQSTATIAGAIALGSTKRFDALLLDCQLGGGSALTVLRTLRAIAGSINADTPAIAMSADLDDARVDAMIDAGFSDAMEKPIRRDRLVRALVSCGVVLSVAASASPVIAARPEAMLTLDDAAGLEACGSIEVLRGLRALLAQELPVYLQEINQTAKRADTTAMHACVHRMRSALGFCGATKLKFLLDHSAEELPSEDTLCAWRHAIAELAVALSSRH
jgi:CheY-like chemotaxis protein